MLAFFDVRKIAFMIPALVQACVLYSTAFAEPKTLAEIALADGLRLDNETSEFGNLEVTSYEILSTEQNLIFAGYFLREGKNGLSILHIFKTDKLSGAWRQRTFDELPLGSVMKVETVGSVILISMHLTPSAGTELILTEDLEFYDRLYGWTVTTLGDDFVIYHQSQRHFAPTHEVELFLYHLSSRTKRKIFPPKKKTKYQIQLSKILADKYSELGWQWCAARNHHCDPERMDSDLVNGIQKNLETDSISFAISYNESIERWPAQRRLVRYNIANVTSDYPIYEEEVLEGLFD